MLGIGIKSYATILSDSLFKRHFIIKLKNGRHNTKKSCYIAIAPLSQQQQQQNSRSLPIQCFFIYGAFMRILCDASIMYIIYYVTRPLLILC